ncbi:hypothetical protein RvY_09632 [Ramazzottius varieornatus]|uniref:Uncharacterized protein n=1 Tax=Ramazzottius varieornatus TaxID=947166 RepID=A0A1D1VA23_RAMVA|nr:hypothetical protein RvY_09632 [Ramazzottius varieornatus]
MERDGSTAKWKENQKTDWQVFIEEDEAADFPFRHRVIVNLAQPSIYSGRTARITPSSPSK